MESKTSSWADENQDEENKKVVKGKTGNMKDVLVVTVGDDGIIWMWKPLEAHSLATLTGHSDRVLAVDMDRENHVASCSLDCSLKLWKPKLKTELPTSSHEGRITFIASSENGSMIITGSSNGVVNVWTFDESGLQLSSSFKAHETAVNCGCFEGFSNNKFVTGGNDNQLIRWEIIDRKQGSVVRKDNAITCAMPVNSVNSKSEENIFFTTWKGDVSLYKPKIGTFVIFGFKGHFDELGLEAVEEWCTSICLRGGNPGQLILGSSLSNVTILDLCSDQMSIGNKNTIFVRTEEKEIESVKYPRPNWIHCVTRVGKTTFVGDSRGKITILSPNEEWSEKIHTSAVTAIAIAGNFAFSSSMDATIKVWRYEENNTIKLIQVGQFFSPAPVTNLKVPAFNARKRRIPFIAGDQLGNVHQLIWHY